ncbi:MAG TPA: serine hydroxymethyltransferase, partial [Myxococcota bacterium]|nr:serine hydroxymethyltransferase [Myxococcota bacterium]
RPSGVRIGTPAATTRGMNEPDMAKLAGWIADALEHRGDPGTLARLSDEVAAFCQRFPVPGLS